MRTPRTPTTQLSPSWGTSSGTNPGENFEEPQDITDVVQLDTEIPRGSRTPTGGLLPGKKVPRAPIGLEIGKSAGGGLGVTVSVPIGGGPISARGGINLGAGGAIKGGSVGVGVGAGPIGASIDVGTDQDEQGRGGCYQYVTVTIGPFSHTYGHNVCEPKSPKKETPPSSQEIFPDFPRNITVPSAGNPPSFEAGCLIYQVENSNQLGGWDHSEITGSPSSFATPEPPSPAVVQKVTSTAKAFLRTGGIAYFRNQTQIFTLTESDMDSLTQIRVVSDYYSYNSGGGFTTVNRTEKHFVRPKSTKKWVLLSTTIETIKSLNCPPPVVQDSPPPLPNPPPKKKKMDDKCCKAIILLQLETLRLMGREVGANGLIAISKKPGFLGEEIERIETPITNPIKPKKIKVSFDTVYEMLSYALKQNIDLDVALDPKSYEVPTGYLQNPKYSRDAEHSLLKNNQPDRDKAGNKRELEINKDDEAKMGGFLQQQQYVFDALRRLEYLFPSGELSDALIAKSLLIPGAKDDVKIHNMVMAYEIQMQYLNAVFGNPREVLTIKDANPAIAGDKPIEVSALTLSDWFRQVVKFQIDTGGDVDAAVNLILRDFRTNLANRTDIIKTAEMTQALFEDSGMREQQDYIPVHLEGDPYAGQWVKGQGFQANPDLEKKTEEATEKVLRETMKPTEIKLKVSRRHKEEKTDMRDLLRGLADFVQRLLSVPTGDASTEIDKLIESAKFKVQTEAALLRANIVKAATASRNRTKKRKK